MAEAKKKDDELFERAERLCKVLLFALETEGADPGLGVYALLQVAATTWITSAKEPENKDVFLARCNDVFDLAKLRVQTIRTAIVAAALGNRNPAEEKPQ